eukprot:7379851-Prymnesium_polylepis.3
MSSRVQMTYVIGVTSMHSKRSYIKSSHRSKRGEPTSRERDRRQVDAILECGLPHTASSHDAWCVPWHARRAMATAWAFVRSAHGAQAAQHLQEGCIAKLCQLWQGAAACWGRKVVPWCGCEWDHKVL